MEDEEDFPVRSFSFYSKTKGKGEISKVLVSASTLSSCYGLSLFPELSKIGSIYCTSTESGVSTTNIVASLYKINSVLFINTSEKLRPDSSISFAEFLIAENWLIGEITVLDSFSENEYIGSLHNRVRFIQTTTAKRIKPEEGLEPGNSLKGVSAAVIMASEVHKLNSVCLVGITFSYELCEENLRVFSSLSEKLGLESNIPRAISKVEQEKYKHQIYS